MKAIKLKRFGGIGNLKLVEIEDPKPKKNEVLVQVKSISINPVDIKTRKGYALANDLKNEDPIILGWDIAGVITQIGNSVTSFNPGDEVFGMVNFPGHGKAYAEFVTVPESHLTLKPSNIEFEDAAASTLAALTAYQVLSKIKSEYKVLIHAAGGGVGHFAIQIANYFGAYVIGTASENKKEMVMRLGLDKYINYKKEVFEELIDEVDFIIDTIGGEYFNRSLKILKNGGTMVSLVNPKVNKFKKPIGNNNSEIYYQLVKSSGSDMLSIANMLSEGSLVPHVSKIFSFNEIRKAHLQIESGRTAGKIVLNF